MRQRERLAMMLPAAAARERQELVGDLFAPKGLVADDRQRLLGFADALGIAAPVPAAAAELLERQLGVAADDVERIIDFVRHAGGEEADARQPLGAHQVLAR